MNFAKARQRLIKNSFDYSYTDADGNPQTETVELTFHEKCLTPAFLDTLTRYEESRDNKAVARELAKVITDWNLDWNGEPFPPTFQNLSERVDIEFLMACVGCISETFQGNGQKPAASQNGSAASEKPETEAVN